MIKEINHLTLCGWGR